MSEEEVQAVAKYLESLGRRLVAFLDIHSYSQMLMFPWGYTKAHCKDYLELVIILWGSAGCKQKENTKKEKDQWSYKRKKNTNK